MRKKLDTRFPAARIKKIMQADEDVGKIALAVPVLVSKALELFLQDLCDRTYEITLQRGAKTMNSLHLKHCVQSYSVFDFLRDIVSRVPDYSHGHSDGAVDDRKRRKPIGGDDGNDIDELKKTKMHEISHGSSGRGRGRRRGRGRGRPSRAERDNFHPNTESDLCTSLENMSKNPNADVHMEHGVEHTETVKGSGGEASSEANQTVQSFDLNADFNATDDTKTAPPISDIPAQSAGPSTETKTEDIPGWPLSDVDKMAIDPLQYAHLSTRIDEEEEDYDEEE